MKFSMIIALPALALAAAVPAAEVEERQLGSLPIPLPGLGSLPALPLNLQCLLGVTGILACIPNPTPQTLLSDLTGCAPLVIVGALRCVLPTTGLPLP
ncbi:hypothetical protein F5X68DRAFT_263765 [Plectosphaerella plurivora]|uniref:Hydrophobin n=1 Tax=Plectosphaerella plurivora TaxID=936078 RepID=A0A9P8V655_9PEZI|nr:hypothetical protein F5X68DRAFT_263765 [Plectosphaerella plurivora]